MGEHRPFVLEPAGFRTPIPFRDGTVNALEVPTPDRPLPAQELAPFRRRASPSLPPRQEEPVEPTRETEREASGLLWLMRFCGSIESVSPVGEERLPGRLTHTWICDGGGGREGDLDRRWVKEAPPEELEVKMCSSGCGWPGSEPRRDDARRGTRGPSRPQIPDVSTIRDCCAIREA